MPEKDFSRTPVPLSEQPHGCLPDGGGRGQKFVRRVRGKPDVRPNRIGDYDQHKGQSSEKHGCGAGGYTVYKAHVGSGPTQGRASLFLQFAVGGHLHVGRVEAELHVVFVARDRTVGIGDTNEIGAGCTFTKNAFVE